MKRFNLIYKFLCLSIVLPSISSAQTSTNSAGPVKHVEIVTFQPGSSDSSKHEVNELYRAASMAMPNVTAYDWGWDLNDTKQNKCIYVTTVNSKGDISTYNATPQHQAIVKSKAVKSITTIDYPVSK
jgi:Stress responsive A/B Barrel Domain